MNSGSYSWTVSLFAVREQLFMFLKGLLKLSENELIFYERIGNWDFSKIKCKSINLVDWDFYEKIRQYTDETSLCLDLGTGGGERALENYPNVGMIIGSDYSKSMIKTANENKKGTSKRIKFVVMDSLKMAFPHGIFDLVSARHTIFQAKQIYDSLVPGGILIIEGVDKTDCWELKKTFGRGQSYTDNIAPSVRDYQAIIDAGFTVLEETEIITNEYYETSDDLLALLLKTPIIDEFIGTNDKIKTELDLLKGYIQANQTSEGILLKRVSYGIIAQKI